MPSFSAPHFLFAPKKLAPCACADRLAVKGDSIKGDNLRIVTLAAALAATFCMATPALATEQVDCSVDGVKIHWVDGSGAQRTSCFGDAGTLGVTLPRSSSVNPDDSNYGWVEYTGSNGATVRRSFEPGQVVPIGGLTITKVAIH
ncbi:hypothetical protein ACFWN2_29095 [Lentzea sp. NPDC058436]|uniref:hypothetical protein n=1 Tax=Lentzea sp. NPDC058436 TaxID=3346499 RepID=UPI003656F416